MAAGTAFKKAEILAAGRLAFPSDLRLPFPMSRSSSGPDAGLRSVVISFEGTRLKTPAERSGDGPFRLVRDEGGFSVLKGDLPFIEGVQLVPCGLHAPDQAFIDLDQGCDFNCSFCAAPRVSEGKRNVTFNDLLDRTLDAVGRGAIKAVAMTGGVRGGVGESAARMASAVERLRSESDVPIGVEPFVDSRAQVEALWSAGADEIKVNVNSWDREIFSKVCPDWDFNTAVEMVAAACDVFGRGRVTSNLIFGLGESDDVVVEGMEALADLGCIANLRMLRENAHNRDALRAALGVLPGVGARRMISLAGEEKSILSRNGLDPMKLKTMCHPCGCCDIVPFKDV